MVSKRVKVKKLTNFFPCQKIRQKQANKNCLVVIVVVVVAVTYFAALIA